MSVSVLLDFVLAIALWGIVNSIVFWFPGRMCSLLECRSTSVFFTLSLIPVTLATLAHGLGFYYTFIKFCTTIMPFTNVVLVVTFVFWSLGSKVEHGTDGTGESGFQCLVLILRNKGLCCRRVSCQLQVCAQLSLLKSKESRLFLLLRVWSYKCRWTSVWGFSAWVSTVTRSQLLSL